MANIVTISDSIKQEIAEKVAEQASAGYSPDAQGNWYVVDGARVTHYSSTAAWKPWHDDADVIHVNDLVWYFGGAEQERADFENGVDGADDFDLTVEFALGYVPDSYDQDRYDRMGV